MSDGNFCKKGFFNILCQSFLHELKKTFTATFSWLYSLYNLAYCLTIFRDYFATNIIAVIKNLQLSDDKAENKKIISHL